MRIRVSSKSFLSKMLKRGGLLLYFSLLYYKTLTCDLYNDSETKQISKRNIIMYPPSSVLQITMGITLIEKLDKNNAVVLLGFQQNADLPKESQSVSLSPKILKTRKFSVFHHFQEAINSYGFNGVECFKKMVCQSAHAPIVGGLLEEIISFVLSPSKHRNIALRENNQEVEKEKSEMRILVEVENLGKNGGNCTRSFSLCKQTPLDLISFFINV